MFFLLFALRFALYAMLLSDRDNFFMEGLPYPLESRLSGLKKEMGPPALHTRYTMSGEAAIQHIFAVLRTTEPGFESLSAGFRTERDIFCRC